VRGPCNPEHGNAALEQRFGDCSPQAARMSGDDCLDHPARITAAGAAALACGPIATSTLEADMVETSKPWPRPADRCARTYSDDTRRNPAFDVPPAVAAAVGGGCACHDGAEGRRLVADRFGRLSVRRARIRCQPGW